MDLEGNKVRNSCQTMGRKKSNHVSQVVSPYFEKYNNMVDIIM